MKKNFFENLCLFFLEIIYSLSNKRDNDGDQELTKEETFKLTKQFLEGELK